MEATRLIDSSSSQSQTPVSGALSPCQGERKEFFWKGNCMSVQAFPRTEIRHRHGRKEASLWAEGRAFPLAPSPSAFKPG